MHPTKQKPNEPTSKVSRHASQILKIENLCDQSKIWLWQYSCYTPLNFILFTYYQFVLKILLVCFKGHYCHDAPVNSIDFLAKLKNSKMNKKNQTSHCCFVYRTLVFYYFTILQHSLFDTDQYLWRSIEYNRCVRYIKRHKTLFIIRIALPTRQQLHG